MLPNHRNREVINTEVFGRKWAIAMTDLTMLDFLRNIEGLWHLPLWLRRTTKVR